MPLLIRVRKITLDGVTIKNRSINPLDKVYNKMKKDKKVFTIKDFIAGVGEIDSKIKSNQIADFLKTKGYDITENSVRSIKAHISRNSLY